MSFSPEAVKFRAATSIPKATRNKNFKNDLDIDFYSIRGNEENTLFSEISDSEAAVVIVYFLSVIFI
jgi:hypothetical protein